MNPQLMKHNLFHQDRFVKFRSLNILLTLFVFIIFLMTLGCSEVADQSTKFDLNLYETKDYKDGQKYIFTPNKNKPTIINFWFPSCPPCISEMPDIDSVYLEYKDQIDVVGIQLIGIDSVSNGKKFVSEGGFSYAIGADLESEIVINYDVTLFPTTLFIDSNGKIIRSWQGIISKEEIIEIINPILNMEN